MSVATARRVQPDDSGAILPLARLIVDLRIAAVVLALTKVLITNDPQSGVVVPSLAGAAVLSFLILRFWQPLAQRVRRRPLLLAVDVVFSSYLLLTSPANAPVVIYGLAAAVLAGMFLSSWRLVPMTLILMAANLGGAALGDTNVDVIDLSAVALSFPLAAAAGTALRRLLVEQLAQSAALVRTQESMVVSAERARLARELHDSVSSTLQGLSMSAQGLVAWVDRDPDRARRQAVELATVAQAAALEARRLLQGLRADDGERRLCEVISTVLEAAGQRGGLQVWATVAEELVIDPEARFELVCILRESLENVVRHADASRVAVSLVAAGDEVELIVQDDGVGLEQAHGSGVDEQVLAASGHYGVIGMRERAERLGGRLSVKGGPGTGTTVVATVPTAVLTKGSR